MRPNSGLLLIGLFSGAFASCDINICLNWKVSLSSLTLICKVHDLHLAVYFEDPSNERVADCLPPFPEILCQSYYKLNSSIVQDIKTKETILKITGQIARFVNGNWTCQHGTKTDTATIEVTVFNNKDRLQDMDVNTGGLVPLNKSQEVKGNNDCIERTTIYGMCTYFASMVCYIFCLKIYRVYNSKQDCIPKRTSACSRKVWLFICSIIFCVVSLIGGILGSVGNDCKSQYILLGLGFPTGIVVGLAFIKIEVPRTKSKNGIYTSCNQGGEIEHPQENSRDSNIEVEATV